MLRPAGVLAKTAVHKKIWVRIGMKRISVPKAKSPRYASLSAMHVLKIVRAVNNRCARVKGARECVSERLEAARAELLMRYTILHRLVILKLISRKA